MRHQIAWARLAGRAAIMVLITSCATTRAAVGAGAPPQTPPTASAIKPTGLCTMVESGTKGYTLSCAKNDDPLWGTNTGLRVTYKISNGLDTGGADTPAEVFGGSEKWLVRIGQHIGSGQTLSLRLTYQYTPTKAVQDEVTAELQALQADLIGKIKDAIVSDKDKWPSKIAINPADSKYKVLATAQTKSGEPSVAAFLKKLGFVQATGAVTYQPTADTLDIIGKQLLMDAEAGLLSPAMVSGLQKLVTPSGCGAVAGAPPPTDVNGLITQANTCLGQISAGPCQVAASGLPAITVLGGAPTDSQIKALQDTLVANESALQIATKAGGSCNGDAKGAALTQLVALAAHALANRSVDARWAALTGDVVTAIQKDSVPVDATTDALTADTERRHYSLSSGGMYLTHTNEFVIPLVATICPIAGGCLRDGDFAWTTKDGWWRALAFDVGVAAGTVDHYQDQRRVMMPGFLLGASYQIVTPLRVSLGGYFFENQENRRWQWDIGIGLTLDAGAAVEMFKLFGSNVPAVLSTAVQ